MNIEEKLEHIIKSKYINGKKYYIHFKKKEKYITIYIKDNSSIYKKNLTLKYLNNHIISKKIKTLEEVLELFSQNNNISELKKLNDFFLYTLSFNFKETKVKICIKLISKKNKKNSSNENKNNEINKFNDLDKIIINEAHNTNNILENNNKLDLIENHENSKEISSSILNEIFEKEEIGVIESKNKIQKEKNILIRDVNIKFPFEPYTEQIKYMEQILLCLESKEEYPNALLESPTGTGKTLSLLCSIFAWNENRIKKSLSSKRIIYCTRTTSQINNLMNELK